MSLSLHITLTRFFHIFRLIAPFFMCGVGWPPSVLVVVVILLIYSAPLLITWLVPVDCSRIGCTGRMQVTNQRLSFWHVRQLYQCDNCEAECQMEVFNPNITITYEYS